jgi:hypothetical protein
MAVMHINNTGRPIRIKTWRPVNSKLSKNDIEFLITLGIKVRVIEQIGDIELYSGLTRQYSKGFEIDIETTCDEQEVMLQLRCNPVLMSDEWVLPNSMSLCTLSHVGF